MKLVHHHGVQSQTCLMNGVAKGNEWMELEWQVAHWDESLMIEWDVVVELVEDLPWQ